MFNKKFRAWFATPEFLTSVVAAIATLAATRFGYGDITPYPLIVFIGWFLGRISALRNQLKNKEDALKATTHIFLKLAMTSAFKEGVVSIIEDDGYYTVAIKATQDTSISFSIPRKEIDGSDEG